MTQKSSQRYGNDSTTEKPVRLGTNLKDEREERKGAIMDHMTFMTIFSLLATVGMVLVILWGMSTVDPQGQGSFQPAASGTFGTRPGSSHLQYEPRMSMIQEFVPWDSTRAVPQEYAFQPSLEVTYRQALKELLAAQARLTTQEREAAKQPFTLTS
jgi:hypothetical protein